MKTTIIFIGIVLIIVGYVTWTDQRDMKLMELCADHETKTLYDCDQRGE